MQKRKYRENQSKTMQPTTKKEKEGKIFIENTQRLHRINEWEKEEKTNE